MENNNNQEEKKLCLEKDDVPKIDFWRWYFPKRPIFILRFILFTYFIQWFIWNVITLVKRENLESVFLSQKNLGGINLVFGPILGTLFIFVTILPLIMMWVFYAMAVSKWEIRDPALRIWAGIGIVLLPFVSILFFKLFSLILGIVY